MVKLEICYHLFIPSNGLEFVRMSIQYCYPIFAIMLLVIFLPNLQTTFAQDDKSNKIEVNLEESVSTREDSPVDEPESIEVTLEESLSMAEDEDEPILSPHQQMRSGISAENVVCKSGFDLIIKASNGSAACVFPSTASALAERGWSK